ncbi:S-layer homology domain-containing protein [Ureibacillus chungkukjangi]|uniref:S-layer homology domain-containing protein n=1 Tax=Ureibacillus chungkukjangi TaxID=1202712 RepID=UPI00187D22A8|nr:S-layer homology domain-containing protein [Ureibacillus chungkukjangi]
MRKEQENEVKKKSYQTDKARKLLMASMAIGTAVSGATMLAPQEASADTFRYTWDVYESYTATGSRLVSSGYWQDTGYYETYYTYDQTCSTCLEYFNPDGSSYWGPGYNWIAHQRWVSTGSSWVDTSYYENYNYTAWRDTGNDVSSLDPNAYATNDIYRNKRSAVENYSPVLSELSDATNFKNDIIDLTIDATDIEDGTPSTYNATSSDESIVKVLSIDGNKVQLQALQVGTSSITISTTDSYGETTSKVFDLTVLNTKAVVDYVVVPKMVVIDDTTDITFTGKASDVDGDEMTIRLTAGNGAIFISNPTLADFELNLRGRDILKGYYFTKSLIFEAYDGTEYSLEKAVDVPLIKVSDATDYLRLLRGHSHDYENWTDEQQALFHKIYEEVLTYEQSRSSEELETIREDITQLKTLTSLETSTTLTEWQNRIEVIEATVAMEKAENSLLKTDYLTARTLAENFIASNVQEQFVNNIEDLTKRYEDLERYHVALDLIVHLEENNEDINWESIFEAQNKVELIENTTNKAALQGRVEIIKDTLMSNLEQVTVIDLLNYGVENVKLNDEEWYSEYFDAFTPLGTGNKAQELVDYVNELKSTLANLSRSSIDRFITKVPSYANLSLQPTIDALEGLLNYRISFYKSPETDSILENKLDEVPFELTLSYMQLMKNSMYETIEYNVTHDSEEKNEGGLSISPLWEGSFKNEMREYIDNKIPEIMFTSDNKEYINNGTLTVVGSIQDENDSDHTVIVEFNGEEKTVTTNNRSFTVTFDNLPQNVFTTNVEVQVKDRLTKVNTTITNKPVITTNDVSLYRQYAEALEIDKDTLLQEFDSTILVNLQKLIDDVKSITSDSSERSIRDTENLAVSIGGKGGEVEAITKKLIQEVRLEWLFKNYLTATVDDYVWAGISSVTSENINDLRQIITDYKASYSDGIVPTPTIEDYEQWLTLQPLIVKAAADVSTAKQIHTSTELTEAITIATESISNLPSWLSVSQNLLVEFNSIKDYRDVLILLEKAELTFDVSDKNVAETAVSTLTTHEKYDSLVDRLNTVQQFIDTKALVVTAESTRTPEDIESAKNSINLLPDHDLKTELETRIQVVIDINNTIASVVTAESTITQEDTDKARLLVEALPESLIKDELLQRLQVVQEKIDEILKEYKANTSVSLAESSLLRKDADAAQAIVNELLDEVLKGELQYRLDALYVTLDQIDGAVGAVEQAESTNIPSDLTNARALVDLLEDSPIKTALQERLNAVQQIINNMEEVATEAVNKAESTLSRNDVSAAQEKVNLVTNPTLKQELQERLDELEPLLVQFEEAVVAVETAETTKDEVDIQTAKDLINLLPEGQGKTLQERIDIVELSNQFADVVSAVELAVSTKDLTDIQKAQELIDLLPEIPGKQALQTSIDKVNQYLAAEQAVTKAEETLIQKHKNDAYALVSALDDTEDRQLLIERLDALQLLIDQKVETLVDTIINNINEVTVQALADYTNETVYTELMEDYKKELSKLDDTEVTKENIIQIVQLVNKLEIAKRSMNDTDIQAYQTAFAQSTLPTKAELPAPTVLTSISGYLTDDEVLEDVITELATALDIDEESIRLQVEAILAGIEEAQSGEYQVQYETVDGEVIATSVVQDAKYGEILVQSTVPVGYAIVGETTKTVQFNKDEELVVTFVVELVQDETLVSDYLIRYVDSNNNVIMEKLVEDVQNGEVIVTSEAPEGYEIVGDTTTTLTLSEEAEELQVATFVVSEIMVKDVEEEEQSIEGTPSDEVIQESDVKSDIEVDTLPVSEEEIQTESIESEPAITISGEMASLRSFMYVASLNDSYITSTPVTTVENANVSTIMTSSIPMPTVPTSLEQHAEYLFKAFYALASVKAYVTNPTEAYRTELITYISSNLYDGEYKQLLFTQLGYDIAEIGEDGIQDLTAINPTLVINPSFPIGGGGSSVGEPIKEEQIEVNELENGVEWVISNPTKTNYTLEEDGIAINLSLDDKAEQWNISWTHLGDNHYQLVVKADGKTITKFKKPIIVKAKHDFAYLLRQTSEGYGALPYNYANGTFTFNATIGEHYYFSTDKKSFIDTQNVFSRDAIEELASRHILVGTGNDKFSPYTHITRGQLAGIVANALDLKAKANNNSFADTKGQWFEEKVQALFEAGITVGTTETTFSPYANITRQQAAAMLLRVIEMSDVKLSYSQPKFKDNAKIADYAKEAVGTLQALGIVSGKEGNIYEPNGKLTRAQFAQMFVKTLQYTGQF